MKTTAVKEMETLEFLQRIYGNLHEGFLTVTTLEKDGKSNTRWFEPGRLEEMTKSGSLYGWGVAEYSTPEKFFGEDFTSRVYQKSPEESYQRIVDHLRSLFPDTDENTIRKILK